jgi:hypothetical protein
MDYKVEIILIVNGKAQNGAKVALASFVSASDAIDYIERKGASDDFRGVCMYLNTNDVFYDKAIWLNGGRLQ